MPRPSSINPKITSTRNILVMDPDELRISLGVATKMPQTYLNTPSPRSGFHRKLHINSYMTKVLLTAIRCWTLHREWSYSSFISFQCQYHHALACDSFVHTWMPPVAEKLIMENLNKNIVDLDEYPAASVIHNRCISMSTFDLTWNWFLILHTYISWTPTVADLWKAPKEGKVIGTATAGSSEAIMLGGLALKKRWQEARKAAGKDYYHPNIIFGSNAQVALEKFARWVSTNMSLFSSFILTWCYLLLVISILKRVWFLSKHLMDSSWIPMMLFHL